MLISHQTRLLYAHTHHTHVHARTRTCTRTDQAESESLLSSPHVLPADSDAPFDSPSDVQSMHSALSTSSSIVDLRDRTDKVNAAPTSTTTTSPPPHPVATIASTTESGDFGLRVTAYAPTPDAASRNDWVRLNMGGRIFATTR